MEGRRSGALFGSSVQGEGSVGTSGAPARPQEQGDTHTHTHTHTHPHTHTHIHTHFLSAHYKTCVEEAVHICLSQNTMQANNHLSPSLSSLSHKHAHTHTQRLLVHSWIKLKEIRHTD